MELFFRKYFWAVNVVVLLLAAFLAAKTVNAFIESALTPPPDVSAMAAAAARPQVESAQKASVSIDVLSRVTGIPKPEPKPVANPAEPAPMDPNAPPVKSGLRVRLVGTMVANRSEWSLASIQDAATGDVTIYMVADRLQTAEVVEIERLRVIVKNHNRREYIDQEPGDGSSPQVASYIPPTAAAAAAVHAVGSAPPPSTVLGQGIQAVSENDYVVPRVEVDRTLSNLNDVAMQARIVPSFKDGVANGFKLFSIRPDSIYTRIGIQNGDVIRRINGYEINSPDKALEVYMKLKEAARIEVELDRNGSIVRKTYNVR